MTVSIDRLRLRDVVKVRLVRGSKYPYLIGKINAIRYDENEFDITDATLHSKYTTTSQISKITAYARAPKDDFIRRVTRVQDEIRRGDWVTLKAEAKKHHTCPEGRENNVRAKVAGVYGPLKDQVRLESDLFGCKFWNLSDLRRSFHQPG